MWRTLVKVWDFLIEDIDKRRERKRLEFVKRAYKAFDWRD